MTTVVLDASVLIKWLFQDPETERDTERATDLVSAVIQGEVKVVQPIHWLVEVGAVLSRKTPARAEQDIGLLAALDFPVRSGPEILMNGARLAIELEHHLFDTLYQAVAIESGAILVTADDRYLSKAVAHDMVVSLRDWQGPE